MRMFRVSFVAGHNGSVSQSVGRVWMGRQHRTTCVSRVFLFSHLDHGALVGIVELDGCCLAVAVVVVVLFSPSLDDCLLFVQVVEAL